MRILKSILFLILGFLGVFSVFTTNSYSANCLFKFADPTCGHSNPPYCTDGNCTLTGGLIATNIALDGNLTDKPLSVFIVLMVKYLLGFITLIAVIYIIYAGFQIMTGAGDEEKNKKAKGTITYVIVGMILMWLAYSIVDFIVDSLEAVAIVEPKRSYTWSIIPTANATVYSESSTDTFRDYQNKLRIAIQDLESELKINKSVNTSNIQNIKNLVQGAFDRLPDFGDSGTQNDTMKRAVDRDIELAIRNPSSTSQVGAAITSVANFISSAKIETIQGSINATPGEGNAPITVSFEASNIHDPSGSTPDQMNYIWWIRENGGGRRELGRGKSLIYTFSQEGTYTVFLDVISGSRNSKKRIDVLPLTTSKTIDVKPRLGQILLLINGVNVSNIDTLKINPALGKMGIIFDATASRATGGNIINTKWDFGNGNTMSYDGTPVIERQIFANNGDYPILLTLKSNNGQTFTKNLRLIVRNPSAVIQADSLVGNIGKDMYFSSVSYFTNAANVEYSWQIQDDNNKKLINNLPGNSLNYTFAKVGTYVITLNARSPNGEIDTDSKQVTIESQSPVINLETPVPISKESPNILIFDGSKSFDPDTMSRKGLTYTWYLNGEKIVLDNQVLDGAKGQLKFNTVGSHTVRLSVANSYGKVSTSEKNFSVLSVLSANMLITPRVAPIGTTIHLIGQSENADFFEWNMGDGSPIITGNRKIIQHKYEKAGVYDITLTVTNGKSSESNIIKRRIYITNAGSPFAMIGINNPSSTSYYDTDACASGATVVNRSDITTFDASKSINIDGGNANLSYTWNYFGKVKTTPTLTEKLTEIGCFPIKLTVRSATNGSSHTSTEYVAIKNLPPEVTSISTNIDTTKKDSQKLLVRVTADGALDPDGVITSYIWYYTTESDKEPQNIQITQSPSITFVLPNITEKYYFGVILEDNDGAKTNSIEDGSEQVPLIIDNKNGNIYMPLITLTIPNNTILVGEPVKLSASAKTIIGTDITRSAEYAWDFDGDGRYDEKTTNPTISYTYKNPGAYSLKVRVTNNGVSNVKHGTIHIRSPLKASANAYSLPDGSLYIINTSEGQYDTATWVVGSENIESRNSIRLTPEQFRTLSGSAIAMLRTSLGGSNESTYVVRRENITILNTTSSIHYQSSPIAIDNMIHIKGSSDQLNLSMLGNQASTYEIDLDTNIDSDMDGITDNDIDNKNHPSYNDGSIFTLSDFADAKTRERTMRITTRGDGTEKFQDIILIFDFIPESSTVSGESDIISFGEGISEFDKSKLNELSQMIRTTDNADRIILMKQYNILIENWTDSFSKAKSLIDLQGTINITTLSEDKKTAMSTLIDNLLVGDAASADEITIATKLIQDLIPESSPNRDTILKKLEDISLHPNNLEKNKPLGKEILELIKNDTTIEDVYKIHIKDQLLIIINGGQTGSQENANSEDESKNSSSILSFIGGFVMVFLYILGGISLVIIIGYIFYLMGRKNEDIGFQDFVIDSVFHSKKTEVNSGIKTSDGNALVISPTIQATPISSAMPSVDPLSIYSRPGTETTKVENQDLTIGAEETVQKAYQSSENTIPSWLQVNPVENNNISKVELGHDNDGLQVMSSFEPTSEPLAKEAIHDVLETRIPIQPVITPTSPINEGLGSWLHVGNTEEQDNTVLTSKEPENTTTLTSPSSTNGDLPDWLIDSIKTESTITPDVTAAIPDISEKPKTKKQKKKSIGENTSGTDQQDIKPQTPSDIPDWLK